VVSDYEYDRYDDGGKVNFIVSSNNHSISNRNYKNEVKNLDNDNNNNDGNNNNNDDNNIKRRRRRRRRHEKEDLVFDSLRFAHSALTLAAETAICIIELS